MALPDHMSLCQGLLGGWIPKLSGKSREFINSHRLGGIDPFLKSLERETKHSAPGNKTKALFVNMATKRKAMIQDTEILAIFIESSTQSDQFVCDSESSDSEFVPAHFEFTVQCMEVLLFIANSSLSSMFIDSYALVNVWLAALPPLTGEAHKVLRLLQGLLDVTHQALVAEWKEGYQGLRHSTVVSWKERR
uniref:Uncharacterized protein n=1 Tax=Timema bartmani TaxID=61472 RepID=A0A7R9EWX1_9NEOP|nr:unnamed protein product [Timema bartmani]